MRVIGNLIWFILIGIWVAVANFLIGLACCITIVLIPFGLQHFKIARYVIWPFGRQAVTDFERHPFLNIIWIVFNGLGAALGWYFIGALFCITLIGIPFGKKCFKIANLAFVPFGAILC